MNRMFIYRRKRRMRQFDLGKALGVTEQQISRYEHERDEVDFEKKKKISKILKTSMRNIFPEQKGKKK